MKKLITVFLITSVFSCSKQSSNETSKKELIDNEEMKVLYEADQSDRRTENIDWAIVSKRDSARMSRIYELLDSNKVSTSVDYANAAMIFQHGDDTIASGMAVQMMKKAIDLDSSRNKWLLAAAIDRDLMRRGKPQIYGTQFLRMDFNEPWKMYDLDSTKVSDEERREYRVETLVEQKEKLRRMNMKKLSGLLAAGNSIDEIIQMAQSTDLNNSEYDLSENGLNIFGYQLMAEGRDEDALKILKLNTELYPKGFNTYDSYGEILLKQRKVEKGMKAYKKSLELNPNNDNAKRVLADLEKK